MGQLLSSSFLFLLFIFMSTSSSAEISCSQYFSNPFHQDSQGRYLGLSEEGVLKTKQERDALRDTLNETRQDVLAAEALTHALAVAQAAKFNMMLTGSPGASKSTVLRRMIRNLWYKLLGPTTHIMALLGGQTRKGIEEGKEDINTEQTMLDAQNVALDEADKAPPSLFPELLSILNPEERFITIRGKEHKASRLQSIFTTSNATLYEMMDGFAQQGPTMQKLGLAFMNRFQIKAKVINWLPIQMRAVIDQRKARLRDLEVDAQHSKVARDELTFLRKKTEVDYAFIRKFAIKAFVMSPELQHMRLIVVDNLRKRFNQEKMLSEKQHKQNPKQYPIPFMPPAELSTRLDDQITQIILFSAAVDFLSSPMATDKNIQSLMKNPIELGVLSLWRAYLVMTTVGPGDVRFNPAEKSVEFNILNMPDGTREVWDAQKEEAEAPSMADAVDVRHMIRTQEIFKEVLETLWKEDSMTSQILAQVFDPNHAHTFDFDKIDFEVAMHFYKEQLRQP